MSSDGSAKSSNNSGSSSSPNQTNSFHDSRSITDLTIFGAANSTLSRTGTVRRVVSSTLRKDKGSNSGNDDGDLLPQQVPLKANSPDPVPIKERLRKSLDSSYRHSLESISEYKTRHSFSTTTSFTSRATSSIDSSSTDSTDYALRYVPDTSTNPTKEEKSGMSPSSSYLSWIESVNSEYFGSAVSSNQEAQDVDGKVGEWNNFWLNYNSARSKHAASSYQTFGCSSKAADDVSDAKSNSSGQKDYVEGIRNNNLLVNGVTLTMEEIQEAMVCTQRIADILSGALKRTENDVESLNNESYYSEMPVSRHNSCVADLGYNRERSVSCVVDPQQTFQKQKQLLQSQPQSSSTSCINSILNTGVTDMLRRVISKSKRDVSNLVDSRPLSRSSFSEWSTK